MKIIDKIKTVSSLIPSKTKEEEKNVAPCDVPEDTLCDSEEPIEEQIEKEGESGIGKYLSRVDWVRLQLDCPSPRATRPLRHVQLPGS